MTAAVFAQMPTLRYAAKIVRPARPAPKNAIVLQLVARQRPLESARKIEALRRAGGLLCWSSARQCCNALRPPVAGVADQLSTELGLHSSSSI